MSNSDTYDRNYRRLMMRSMFQSLFWRVFSVRKKESNLTITGLADRLGHDKSYVSRIFSALPNWQIDKLSDLSDALGVDLVIEARDRRTGRVFAPHSDEHFSSTSSKTTSDIHLIGSAAGTVPQSERRKVASS